MKATALVFGLIAVLAAAPVGADSYQDKVLLDRQGSTGNPSAEVVDRDGGDDCAGAPTITVAAYTDSGDTTGYTDSWGPSVGGYGQDGEDQSYKIVLSAADTITVTVTPNDSGFDLSTYIFAEAECANYNAVFLEGVDSGFAGDAETFTYAAAAGTYYIIVDSFLNGEVGPFTIEVASNVPVELTNFSVQ